VTKRNENWNWRVLRRVVGAAAASAITLVTLAVPAQATSGQEGGLPDGVVCTFTDSAPQHVEIHAHWTCDRRLMMGYQDGTFGYGKHLTRGEAAVIVYRYSGDEHSGGTTLDFSDVPATSSAFTAASWMKAKGYANGYADGTFRPGDPITRGELAAFLYRSIESDGFKAPSRSMYSDLEPGKGFYTPVAWLSASGAITGYGDGTFRPNRLVTRGEAAKMVYIGVYHDDGMWKNFPTG
jgi:hypothetical protein